MTHPVSDKVRRFLIDEIGTVERLDLLLFMHRHATRWWAAQKLTDELDMPTGVVQLHLEHLSARNLLDVRIAESVIYSYKPGREELAQSWRRSSVHTTCTAMISWRCWLAGPPMAPGCSRMRFSSGKGNEMASVVYALCALTSGLCATLLVRAYLASRARLLLWSSLSFMGLTCNNLLLFIDLVMVPTVDLSLYRGLAAAISVMVLLLGLIWDSR